MKSAIVSGTATGAFLELFDNATSPVLAINEAGNITYFNPAFREYFNVPNIALGMPLTRIVTQPDLLRLIAQSQAQGEISLPDFERILSAELVKVAGTGTLVVMQDVTHLRAAARVRSDLVNDISRNLRSPLTAIGGYAELLGRIGELNDQQKNFVEKIMLSVDAMTRLINDLMDLEKAANSVEGTIQPVDLRIIVRYATDGMHDSINRKKLKLELNIPSQLPNIMGNPIRLRQMVGALLQNAIDYTPEQGHIQIQLWAEEQVVFLKVQDSGIGIPAEEQAFVFDKFYRATNTLKMSSRSGLGLSIVKNIVDQHGGRIWLESHLEQGSIFTVMLPAASRDSA